MIGGVAVKTTNSEDTKYSQGNTTSTTNTMSTQTSSSHSVIGTQNTCSPVDHDYDVIWLWINPLLLFTQSYTGAVTWNGYGYDPYDVGWVDVEPFHVGCLNGNLNSSTVINCSAETAYLARPGVVRASRPLWRGHPARESLPGGGTPPRLEFLHSWERGLPARLPVCEMRAGSPLARMRDAGWKPALPGLPGMKWPGTNKC